MLYYLEDNPTPATGRMPASTQAKANKYNLYPVASFMYLPGNLSSKNK